MGVAMKTALYRNTDIVVKVIKSKRVKNPNYDSIKKNSPAYLWVLDCEKNLISAESGKKYIDSLIKEAGRQGYIPYPNTPEHLFRIREDNPCERDEIRFFMFWNLSIAVAT